jgi:hypothetical protein
MRPRRDAGRAIEERVRVEVRIGVAHANRELTIELSQSGEDVRSQISKALESNERLIVFTDDRGRTICVPLEKLAYVEISGEGRRMGFAR